MRVVVALSLFVGLAAAAVNVVVSAGRTERVTDALVLLGFTAGWALLLALSAIFTDHPQRWAAVPTAVMGVSGAALLAFTPGSATMDALGWVWPPAMLGLLRAPSGELPLYVLTAPTDAQTNWLTPQTELAALSDNSGHLVVAGASHQSLLDNQAAAAVSSEAITQVVDAARTGAPCSDRAVSRCRPCARRSTSQTSKHLIRRKEMNMRDDAKNVATTEGNQVPMEESNDVGDRRRPLRDPQSATPAGRPSPTNIIIAWQRDPRSRNKRGFGWADR